jgi:hypothetical protein
MCEYHPFQLIGSYFFFQTITGSQSMFDLCFMDFLRIGQFASSNFCIVGIISRFDIIIQFSSFSIIFVTIVSSIYTIGFVMLCMHCAMLFALRVLCLYYLTFLEETIGEYLPQNNPLEVVLDVLQCLILTNHFYLQTFSLFYNCFLFLCDILPYLQ